jgi:hypothetical protein
MTEQAPDELRTLTFNGLAAAAAGDGDGLADAVDTVSDRYGRRGLFAMLWAWSSPFAQLLRTVNPTAAAGGGGFTVEVDHGPDGAPATLDEIPPRERFVARWLVAAANDDIDLACHRWEAIAEHDDAPWAVVELARICAQSAEQLVAVTEPPAGPR